MLLDTGPSNNSMAAEMAINLGLEVWDCSESTITLANGMALVTS